LLILGALAFAQMPDRNSPPVVRHRVEPEYSLEARAAGLEGDLMLYLEVEADGKPTNMRVIQGLGMGLDENALAAVRQWQFQPASVGSTPTRVAQSVEFPFRLNPSGAWRIRHTAYAVMREDEYHSEPVEKPVLIAYSSPKADACGPPGEVVVARFDIDKQGAPAAIRVVSASSSAAGSAVSTAAQRWKFRSPLGSGHPRAASATFTLACGTEALSNAVSRVGAGTTAPSLLSKVEPEYSETARKSKYQGSVMVTLQVDPSGFASHMLIYRMLGQGLDANAMEAIRTWRFKPATRDGKSVGVYSTIEVTFRLM
jgi:TonB family protein